MFKHKIFVSIKSFKWRKKLQGSFSSSHPRRLNPQPVAPFTNVTNTGSSYAQNERFQNIYSTDSHKY